MIFDNRRGSKKDWTLRGASWLRNWMTLELSTDDNVTLSPHIHHIGRDIRDPAGPILRPGVNGKLEYD